MRPLRKPEIMQLLDRHGLEPNKKFGQHFLADPQLLEALLADCRISPSDTVIEIGAGTGNLTILLAKDARQVLAVERDRFLEPVLREITSGIPNVHVIMQDFLEYDLAQSARDFGRLIIVGNLPYYVSTEILIRLCHNREFIRRAYVTIQKEVADRIIAKPGTSAYGRLSVAIQLAARPALLRKVTRYAFVPIPKVDSSFVELDFSDAPSRWPRDIALFDAVVMAAFEQRRKTLKNALMVLERIRGLAPERIHRALEKAVIDPNRRGETLSVNELILLSDILAVD